MHVSEQLRGRRAIEEPAGTEDHRGFSLIIVLLVLVLLTAMGLTLMFTTETERAISRNYTSAIQATYSAEAGIQAGMQGFKYDLLNDSGAWANRWLVIPATNKYANPPNCGPGVTADVCIDYDASITGYTGQVVVNLDPWTDSDPAEDSNAGFPSSGEWPPADKRTEFKSLLQDYVPWMFGDTGSGEYYLSIRSIYSDDNPTEVETNELSLISEGASSMRVKTNLSITGPVKSFRKLEVVIEGQSMSQYGNALVAGTQAVGDYRVHGNVLNFNEDADAIALSFMKADTGIYNTITPYTLSGYDYKGIDSFWFGESQLARMTAACGGDPPAATVDCIYSQNHLNPPDNLWISSNPPSEPESLDVVVRVKAGKIQIGHNNAFIGVPEGVETPSESHRNPVSSFLANETWTSDSPGQGNLNAIQKGAFDFTDPDFKFINLYEKHKTLYHIYENYMHYLHNDAHDEDTGYAASTYTDTDTFQEDGPGIWALDLTGVGEGNVRSATANIPDTENTSTAKDNRASRYFFVDNEVANATLLNMSKSDISSPPTTISLADAIADLETVYPWNQDLNWKDDLLDDVDAFYMNGGSDWEYGWNDLNSLSRTSPDFYGIHLDNRGTAKQEGAGGAAGDPWNSMAAAILMDILQPRLDKCWEDDPDYPDCAFNNADSSKNWDPNLSKLYVNNVKNAPAMYKDAGVRLRVIVHLDALKSYQDYMDLPDVHDGIRSYRADRWVGAEITRNWKGELKFFNRPWEQPSDLDPATDTMKCQVNPAQEELGGITDKSITFDDDPVNDLLYTSHDYQAVPPPNSGASAVPGCVTCTSSDCSVWPSCCADPANRNYSACSFKKWLKLSWWDASTYCDYDSNGNCELGGNDRLCEDLNRMAVGACMRYPSSSEDCWCRIMYQPETKIKSGTPYTDSRFWMFASENEPTGHFALMLWVPGDNENDPTDNLDTSPIKRPTWYVADSYNGPGYDFRRTGLSPDKYSPYGLVHTLVWSPVDFRISKQRGSAFGQQSVDYTRNQGNGYSLGAAAIGEPIEYRLPRRDWIRSCPEWRKDDTEHCFSWYGSLDAAFSWPEDLGLPNHHGGSNNLPFVYVLAETNLRMERNTINPLLGPEWYLSMPSATGYFNAYYYGPNQLEDNGDAAVRYDGYQEILGGRSTTIRAPTNADSVSWNGGARSIGGFGMLKGHGVVMTKSGGITFGAYDTDYNNLVVTDGRYIFVSFNGESATNSDGTAEDVDGTDDNPNNITSGQVAFFDSVVPIGRYGCEDFSSTVAYEDTLVYNAYNKTDTSLTETTRVAMYSITQENLYVNKNTDSGTFAGYDSNGASLAGSWLAKYADFGIDKGITELMGLGYYITPGKGCDSPHLPTGERARVKPISFGEVQLD